MSAWRSTAVAAAGLLVVAAVQAQAPAYFTSNCSGCHGDPAQISSPSDGRGLTIIGVGAAAWMNDDVAFKVRLNQVRSSAAAMATLHDEASSTNRDIVRQYLINLRDGRISTTTRNFPSTNVGSTSTLPVTLTNDRFLAASFTISKSGTHPGDFTVSGCGLNASGLNGSVPSAGTCSLSIDYQPGTGSATSRSASFTVNYSGNEGGNPTDRIVSLTGSVPAAVFSFSAGTATTGARVDLGQSSDSNVGTITNTGQATLSVTSIALLPPAPAGATYTQIFSPIGACSSAPTLTAGQSCGVWIRFAPAVAGTTSATFRITPGVGALRDATLQGTGTQPIISPTAPSLPFGNVQLGVPQLLPLVVSNTGTAPMTFSVAPGSPAARSGANPGDFAVGGTCQIASPVAPGGTCTLNVTFTPAAMLARSATLTISADASNGPLVILLTGNGVALPEPVLTYPASDFPDTVIGETAAQTRTVTIHNDRTRDISYAVNDITDFQIGAESCAGRVVTSGSDCTVAIRFRPTLAGGESRRQGTLTFTFAGTGGDIAPSNSTGAVAGVALLPLAQSATMVNAAAVVGTPTTSSLLLTNRSAASITLATFTFGGATPGDYALDASNGCVAGAVLTPTTSCTLVIRFAPATSGSRNATLAIGHSAPGSLQNVTLLGNATPAPQGRIELSALSLAFADTQLGASTSQSLIVRNGGNLTLTFNAFTFAGAALADYARAGDCNLAVPLAIGSQCTLTLTFAPSVLGARSASLAIASDASNGTAVLSLAGAGVPVPLPLVTLTPALIDFGTQTIGGIFPARRVRLANSGTADLALNSVVVEGTGFASVIPTSCPALLTPGSGCDVDIVFAATAAANFSGRLRVSSNAAGSPHLVTLQGVGTVAAVPSLVWSPAVTGLDFGAVSAGSLSAVQSVTLRNLGPGGVNLTVLNAIGPDAASFSVVGGTCTVGAPLFDGQTCQVDLRFAPGSAGVKTASVQIASTGSFPPALSLAGIGLAGPNPSLGLSATSLAFDTTRIGAQSLPTTLRLASSGSGVVTVSSVEVTGAYAVRSSSCPATPFTLPAGSECTVSLSFAPTDDGPAPGMMRVTSDAAPAVREVALSGSGEKPTEVSSGGCTIGGANSIFDPSLWLLLLVAVGVLVGRWLRRRGAR